MSFSGPGQIVRHVLAELLRFRILGGLFALDGDAAHTFVERHHGHQFRQRLSGIPPGVGLQMLVDGIRGQADDLLLLRGRGGQIERPFCDLDADFLVQTLTFQPGDALVYLPYQLIQLLFGGAVVTAGGKGFSQFQGVYRGLEFQDLSPQGVTGFLARM